MVHSRSHLSRQFSQLHKHYFSNKDKFDLSIVPLIIKSNYWISTMDHWNGKKLFDVYSKTVVTDGERTADVNPGATINQAEKHSNQSHKFQSHQTEHQSNRSIKRSSAHIQEVRKEMLQQLEGSIENQEEAEKEEECRAKGHLTRSTV
uniref:CACTA en-spm transposon protein n=1 Tax=Caenorhabditis tropicalis TaxID=1561998 RepID=A0A1I7TVJ0_9PELO